MRARVIKSTGSFYILQNEKNEILEARLRGKIKLHNLRTTNPIAVGDYVEYEEYDQYARILSIEKRNNYLIRKSVNLSKSTHIIAANIDLACILFTIENPATSLGFLDRFLITCEAYNIPSLIIFNKEDSWNDHNTQSILLIDEIYRKIGYKTLHFSSIKGDKIDQLERLLKNKTSMFFGHSGSGKSTLINLLLPNLHLKTAHVSSFNDKGQHTTTFAQMYSLDFGGYIIDTPGVKEFGLVEIENDEIQDYFPEIFNQKQYCKFNNCLHQNEPQCAVLKAVEENVISEERYFSYLKLLEI